MNAILQYGNIIIPYMIKESANRKTVNISVRDGEVAITVPAGIDETVYQPVLQQKALWITKQLLDHKEMQQESRKLEFRSGEKLPYLGRQYRLKVESDTVLKASLQFKQGKFHAAMPPSLTLEEQRSHLYSLYTA